MSFRGLKSLPIDWAALKQAAASARVRAHAPYSRFFVGAALLGESGRVYVGCNVENASYGLTLCAERSAVARAVLEGEKRFLAVVAVGGKNKAVAQIVAPCGACRQVLAEFGCAIEVLLPQSGSEKKVKVEKLLPQAFTLD